MRLKSIVAPLTAILTALTMMAVVAIGAGPRSFVVSVCGTPSANVSVFCLNDPNTNTTTNQPAPFLSYDWTTKQIILSPPTTWLHVANNAALASFNSLIIPGVMHRDGYYQAGDMGAADYIYSASPCSLYAGAGEMGAQVPTPNGKCWLLSSSAWTVNAAVFGASTNATDNGPFFDHAYAWAATQGGAFITVGSGTFNLASTFDCHSASSTRFNGRGNNTVLYRTADYGSTMTCSDAHDIHVGNMWLPQDIGSNPVVLFKNPTTHGAHFDFHNISHFTFDDVITWNMTYNYSIINCIDGTWTNPRFLGYWDGTHNQTITSILFDGPDGVGLGHPQLMRIINPTFGSYLLPQQTVTLTSGSQSRTITKDIARGPFAHILVKSMEDMQIIGGVANDAFDSTLYLMPRGDPTKPILKIKTTGVFYDGAGNADVHAENSGSANLSPCNPFTGAHDISISNSHMDGELEGNFAVLVEDTTACPAIYGLNIDVVSASGYVKTPFFIGSVDGGHIMDSNAYNYNVFGVYANDVAGSSGAWVFGHTSNFYVDTAHMGGGPNFEPIDLAHPPGTVPYAANQTKYGVSFQGGLVNVRRRNINNDGYFTDFLGSEPAVGSSCGTGCAPALGADNVQGQIIAGSGSVTGASVAFNGPLASTATPNCRVSDALTSAGVPTVAAVTSSSYTGFSVAILSSIGGGGSFRYHCD